MAVLNPIAVSDEATRLDVAEIATYLQLQLGQKLTAYLAGVTDPKMVGRWAAGKARPRDEREMRLRDAFKATKMLVEAFGARPPRRGGSARTPASTTARPRRSSATLPTLRRCATSSRPPVRSPGARPERRGLARRPSRRAAGPHPP